MRRLFALLMLCSGSLLYAVPAHIQECMDCHGPDGNSQHKDMPSIAGASSVFIEETFAAYQYDMRKEVKSKYRFGDTTRKPTSMKKLARSLTSDQIVEAAEYFSKQAFRPVKQPFDAEKAIVGKAIHQERCEKCHSNGGTSPADDAPILAGQWTPYLESAMQMILDGKRDIDERMHRKTRELTGPEWDALLDFYASQQ